jgi:hypothetical protein
MFQDRELVRREIKEIGNSIKLKDRASNLMGDVLKRDDQSGLDERVKGSAISGSDIKSKYK